MDVKAINYSQLGTQNLLSHNTKEQSNDKRRDLYTRDSLAFSFSQLKDLNFQNSYAFFANESLNFNIRLNNASGKTLTASGFYEFKNESLNLEITYSFDKFIFSDGSGKYEKYELSIKLNLNSFKEFAFNRSFEKEDLSEFIFRIMDELADSLINKNETPIAIILENEDFQELANFQKGKFIKAIFAILQTAYFTAKLKEALDKNYSPTYTILNPKRKKYINFELKENKSNNFELTIHLKKVSETQ